MRRLLGRRTVDLLARGACLAFTALAVVPLVSVVGDTVRRGAAGLSWAVLTELPRPVGESGGGFGHALLGTLELVAVACALGLPVGVLAGVYLSELGGQGGLARAARFSADVLAGVPSIVIGVFVYTLVVLAMGHFSALAGGVALALLMLPTVMRTTEELLRLVPDSLREAGLALGVPRWRVITRVVLRTGAGGIATGVMLAVARAAGETAPLLFTAFGNGYWSTRLDAPIASLPVQIFTYAVSPYEAWHQQAWAAALVLVTLVLVLNLLARAATARRRAWR